MSAPIIIFIHIASNIGDEKLYPMKKAIIKRLSLYHLYVIAAHKTPISVNAVTTSPGLAFFIINIKKIATRINIINVLIVLKNLTPIKHSKRAARVNAREIAKEASGYIACIPTFWIKYKKTL